MKDIKTIVMTAGLPGAGKSTILKTTQFATLPIVDPDKIKQGLKGYDPKAPHLVHKESLIMAREQHLGHLSRGESFVVDGTGTNIDKYLGWVNEAKELGYRIVLLYVKVKTQTAIKRNQERERTLPVEVILQKAQIIEQSTQLIGSLCDEFITIDND